MMIPIIVKSRGIKVYSFSAHCLILMGKQKNNFKYCICSALLMMFCTHTSLAQDNPDAEDYETAKYTQQGRPQMSISRLQEGWLISSYMVGADGKIDDFVILDSSGLAVFENEVRHSMDDAVFAPAKLNGEPVASAFRQQHILASGGMVGSPDFAKDFNAFSNALNEEEFDTASAILERMGQRRIRGNYEFALLSLGRFQLGLEQEMPLSEQIIHLYRSLAYTGNVVETHNDYFLPNDVSERFVDVFERVEGIQNSDQVYAVNGQLSETGAWLLPLFKRGFGITEGHEFMERAQLRCGVGSYNVALSPDADYQVPESARDCALLMQGEPGAKISLVQF
ncbi:MAG: energy transducer TonB [Pseudohongiella nitratireducens]|nr:energy transducer TonB [Pseudohongiella nitratireducens]MDF1622923.1 energy transducer TonB [Pseudohongiella nitratireducens]